MTNERRVLLNRACAIDDDPATSESPELISELAGIQRQLKEQFDLIYPTKHSTGVYEIKGA